MDERNFDIKKVLEGLRKKRKYFSSEADFQLALAMQIEGKYGDNSVICEYVPEYKPEVENFNSRRIHIDILYCKENIPIELKYRTKKADLVDNNNYKISLTNQGARDEGSYGFWRDVSRIKEYIDNTNATKGFVVFLTNDNWYKCPDYNIRQANKYEDFNLNDTNKEKRSGHVSNKEKELNNLPKIKAEWIDWDEKEGFICYIAKIPAKEE